MTGTPRWSLGSKAGIAGAIVGVAAAGVAAGIAAQRYLVRRSNRSDDPFAGEPFGALPASQTRVVTTADGLDLHVEIVDPSPATGGSASPGPAGAGSAGAGSAGAGSGGHDLTLVFVHGFCLDMGTFHFQRQAFADRYRMVFFDQPGHGRSGRIDDGDYSIEHLGDVLRQVIEEVVPAGRIILIGHSMGGMAVMALAERWPELIGERVAGVALISTSGGAIAEVGFGLPQILARFRGPLLPVVRSAAPVAAPVVDRARIATTDLVWLLTRKYGFGTADPSRALVSYVAKMNSATSLDVIARYLRTIHAHDRLRLLAPLRSVPVLVLCGDRDLITPPGHSAAILEVLPAAQFVAIAQGGHVALLEHAIEVNEVLRDFFQQIAQG